MSEQLRNPDGTFATKPKITHMRDDQDMNTGGNTQENTGVIDININDITDESTKKAVEMLLQERETNNSIMKEMSERLKKMDEREQQSKYNSALEEKHRQLAELNVKLADKHKEEKDLEKLDLLISTAREFASGFPDYNKEPDIPKGKFENGRDHPTRFNALTGKME